MDDVVVVIRKSDERTAEVCRLIIAKQIPESQIKIIEEKPFHRAVEETLKTGISNRWLIAVDADVLLFPESISEMVSKANAIKENFFFYQGAVLDKFFLGYRPAGPHLYNCKHMLKALELKAGFENDLRPESFVRSRMEEEGACFVQDKQLFGLHDFEQSYSDIYKKVFRHTIKHSLLMKKMYHLYERFHQLDDDFAIARMAIEDAARYKTERRFTEQELGVYANEAIQKLSLIEKSPIQVKKMSAETFAIDAKSQFLNSLGINERFLTKQRYFRRFKPYLEYLLSKLPF